MHRAYIRPANSCGPSTSRCRIPCQRNMSFFPAAPFFARHSPHPFASGWAPHHHQQHQHQSPFDAALTPFQNGYASAFPFPSFPGGGIAGDLDGLFQAVDALNANNGVNATEGSASTNGDNVIKRHTHRTYTPSFDATEDQQGYHLTGELPGVESKDVDVRFVDPRTLKVSGNTETETTTARDAQGNVIEDAAAPAPAPAEDSADGAAQAEGQDEGVQVAEKEKEDDAQSVRSASSTGSYVKPTVEDEADAERGEKDGDVVMTPATEGGEASAEQASRPQPRQEQKQQARYWISERTTGSFERKFRFPAKVDQDGVTASLKNGVLKISVPKVKQVEREMRKIQVE